MRTQNVTYFDDDTELEGYLAFNSDISKPRPAVIVAHDWSGRNEFACQKAEKLAELGYVGFAIDMFGKDKFGQTTEEKSALIEPFIKNRALLQRRILSGYDALKKIDIVDTTRIGAIGFCFGGMCVLDLARMGTDLSAVVSFHGLLTPPDNTQSIKAKILALHGHDDPMVPPTQVAAFQQEMTEHEAEWEMDIYGNTMHAFTNPVANDKDLGTVYNSLAEKRSWIAMQNFFTEVFL
ncbi:MAG: dienelactone hydrolase family protein [Gammaproteobacteria bacterium]|nr:dienelactone hydrolase family protein [Gammaproteobacteria bacterium]